MATWTDLRDVRPDPYEPSSRRRVGTAIGGVGLALATVVAVIGVVTAGQVNDTGVTDGVVSSGAVGFGLNTVAIATLKVGIAVTLMGILAALWVRADAISGMLQRLRARSGTSGGAVSASGTVPNGDIETEYGPAQVTSRPPPTLTIHRVARLAWAPMLVMGVMAVVAGFVVSLVWAGAVGTSSAVAASAWTQGLQFLGEGLILAGISFLLGTILYGLRTAGGEVQKSLGVPVVTLKMPTTAKLFIGLMALGMMVEMAQLVGYALVAGGALDATAFTWLGSVREVGLGLLLSGIVLALVTIAKVLGFQFNRVTQLITVGS